MFAEIVHHLTDVQRRLPLQLDDAAAPLRSKSRLVGPVLQEPVRLARRPARRHDAVRPAEDVLHARDLLFEVTFGALDDADGVDPEVTDAERAGGADCVEEGGGKIGMREACLVPANGVLGIGVARIVGPGAKVGRLAPRMREGNVAIFGAWLGVEEAEGTGCLVADVDEAFWHAPYSLGQAFFVSLVTRFEPLSDNLKVDIGAWFG